MNIYTYGQMYADLQSWNEDYSSDLQSNLARIIQDGELRAYRDLDLDNLDGSISTSAISQTTGLVTKPTNLLRDRVAVLVNSTPANVGVLVKRTYEFVAEYLIANGATTGVPKYYAEYSQSQWVVAPIPATAYTLSVRGIYPPPLLGDNDQTNSPAAIAALQHTTANVAMTLTSSPWTPTNGEPVQVALTSTGNMSANTFTVVGLDVDGNSLTTSIAGPNAGSASTTESFSSVASITPNTTDGVNSVSAGYLSNNTTWLSTRFPDLLFQACMIETCGYLKRFSAQQVARSEYAVKLQDALQQTRNMQRSDLDDLFVNRQLVTGPPSEQAPSAQPGGAQQPGQG